MFRRASSAETRGRCRSLASERTFHAPTRSGPLRFIPGDRRLVGDSSAPRPPCRLGPARVGPPRGACRGDGWDGSALILLRAALALLRRDAARELPPRSGPSALRLVGMGARDTTAEVQSLPPSLQISYTCGRDAGAAGRAGYSCMLPSEYISIVCVSPVQAALAHAQATTFLSLKNKKLKTGLKDEERIKPIKGGTRSVTVLWINCKNGQSQVKMRLKVQKN